MYIGGSFRPGTSCCYAFDLILDTTEQGELGMLLLLFCREQSDIV